MTVSLPPAAAGQGGVSIDLLSVDSVEVTDCWMGVLPCVTVRGTIICTAFDGYSEGTLRAYFRRSPAGRIVIGPDEGTSPGRYCTGEVETWETESFPRTANGRIQPGRYTLYVYGDHIIPDYEAAIDTLSTTVFIPPQR